MHKCFRNVIYRVTRPLQAPGVGPLQPCSDLDEPSGSPSFQEDDKSTGSLKINLKRFHSIFFSCSFLLHTLFRMRNLCMPVNSCILVFVFGINVFNS